MRIRTSFVHLDDLKTLLVSKYGIRVSNVYLYRRNVGTVYFVETNAKRYVFKFYQQRDTAAALQAADVITSLAKNGFSVPKLILTEDKEHHIKVEMPEGLRIGILYEFVDGKMPQQEYCLKRVGELTANLHNIMREYTKPLIRYGKEHYIDRFLTILEELKFDAGKIKELREIGNDLWSRVDEYERFFCHGDLHTGNMFVVDKDIVLIDFDIVSLGFPMLDASTFCDGTDYNKLDQKGIDRTLANFEEFYKGYCKSASFDESEIKGIFDFIILRHFELNGTIPIYKFTLDGNFWFDQRCFDGCFDWIVKASKMI